MQLESAVRVLECADCFDAHFFGRVLSAVLCIFLFHGFRYQILCWTSALLPPTCSSQLTPPPASQACLSVSTTLSVSLPPYLSFFSLSSVSLRLCLSLMFRSHLADVSSACTFTGFTSHGDDSYEKFET